MTITLAAPKPDPSRRTRISADTAWPLRRADGRTWAESARDNQRQQKETHR